MHVFSFKGELRERKGEDATRTGDHVLTSSVAQSRPGWSTSSVAKRCFDAYPLTRCCPRRVWNGGQQKSSSRIQLQKELKEGPVGP